MTCRLCKYFGNLALAIDQFISAVLGGAAGPTISQRCALARPAKWALAVCAVLTWISTYVFQVKRNHCDWAIQSDGTTLAAQTWNWGNDPGVSAS